MRAAAIEALRTNDLSAFKRLHAFLADRYIPEARETIAMKDLPDGADWYVSRARSGATTRSAPSKIHEIGLAEVNRLNADMERIIEEPGFKGPRRESLKFLRADPRFCRGGK